MKYVYISGKNEIKMWCNPDELEIAAFQQALDIAKLPFIFRHIALMPDAHTGYGMPIGGVVATKNVVVPNFVGVDIGCGMRAVKTSWKIDPAINPIEQYEFVKLHKLLKETTITGFSHNTLNEENKKIAHEFIDNGLNIPLTNEYSFNEFENAVATQCKSLGGGNHFEECQYDEDGNVWIMIHSGSRNIGARIAKYYHTKAQELCDKYWINLPSPDLAYLPFDDTYGQNYFNDMQIALKFAFLNRSLLINNALECMNKIKPTLAVDLFDVHHNYASIENHFGKKVLIHRKGATSAKMGEIGIIPGSMGTCSYIVKGLGNRESFMSCSHGAGRKMGRNEAKRSLNIDKESFKLKNVLHSMDSIDKLDEAPGSYKDIDDVMINQNDLVSIITKLKPIISIKG